MYLYLLEHFLCLSYYVRFLCNVCNFDALQIWGVFLITGMLNTWFCKSSFFVSGSFSCKYIHYGFLSAFTPPVKLELQWQINCIAPTLIWIFRVVWERTAIPQAQRQRVVRKHSYLGAKVVQKLHFRDRYTSWRSVLLSAKQVKWLKFCPILQIYFMW